MDPRLTLAAVALAFLVLPAPGGAVAPLESVEDSLDCRADDAAQPPPQSDAAPNAGALPVGVDDAVLTSLLAALSSVRGIVDVQITLVGAPVFHVLIDGPLPDAVWP